MVKTLWLVTARAGSKSIHDKNIKKLGCHPLLAYRVVSALKLAPSANVWVSTDSRKYAKIASSYGATVPFLRPKMLASDFAKTADVVLHAMSEADQRGLKFDFIAVLEPTSPFVTVKSLQKAVSLLREDKKAQAVVATRMVRPSSFYIQPESKYLSVLAERIQAKGALRRQDEALEVTPSGGFYISRWDSFLKNHSFYRPKTLSLRVSEIEGLEIDEPIDWEWAEFLVRTKKVHLKKIGFEKKYGSK